MSASDFLDLAKGFGASAPIIGLLLYLLWSERKERQDLQKENTEMLKESVALGVSLKSLLERIVSKVGA